MQIEVHDRKARGCRHELCAVHEARAQVLLLVRIELASVMLRDVRMSRKQETSRATRRIAHRIVGTRLHHFDDRLDELARCEVLSCTLRRLCRASREEPLVDVALHVRLELEPPFRLYEIDDEALQRRRVLDVRPRLLEDLAE